MSINYLLFLTHEASLSIVRDLRGNRVHTIWFKWRGDYEMTPYRGMGRAEETKDGQKWKNNNSGQPLLFLGLQGRGEDWSQNNCILIGGDISRRKGKKFAAFSLPALRSPTATSCCLGNLGVKGAWVINTVWCGRTGGIYLPEHTAHERRQCMDLEGWRGINQHTCQSHS